MNEVETLETRSLLARARQLIEWRRYKEALQELEQILRMDPENPDAMSMIANVHLLQEDYKKALHWTEMALKFEPDHLIAWYVRVCVFYQTEKVKEFYKAVEHALRIDPDEPQYYFMKANYENRKKRFREAMSLLEEALRLRPEEPLFLAAASYTAAFSGRFAESEQLERQALQYSAEDSHTLLYLSWAARVRGDHKKQEEYARSAVRLNPEDKQIRDEYLEALQYSNLFYRFPFFRAEDDRDGMYHTKHHCKEGETLDSLAKTYNCPRPILEAMNPHIQHPHYLTAGTVVHIPRLDQMVCYKLYLEQEVYDERAAYPGYAAPMTGPYADAANPAHQG